MMRARDKRRYFAAQFCRSYFVSPPVHTPSLVFGIGIFLVCCLVLATVASLHRASGHVVLAYMTLAGFREKRAKEIADMRQLLDHAENQKRDLTIDEERKWKEMNSEVDRLDKEIERLDIPNPTMMEGLSATRYSYRADPEAGDTRSAFNRYLQDGPQALSVREFRALSVGSSVGGGYLVAPLQMAAEYIRKLKDTLFALKPGFCRVIEMERAESLGVPVLTDMADADWSAELATGTEDSTMAFGRRDLTPHPLAKRIKVSNKLLRAASIDPEEIVRDSMAYKFGVTLERSFMTGSGAQQPLGVFTVSAQGIDTDRDVATGSSGAKVSPDLLINCLYSLKPAYISNSTWIFHRDVLSAVRKLKDGNGQYLWQAGLAGNFAATILDRPYFISEYAPNTFAVGSYVGIVGDFQFYWICIALQLQIQRLIELYAEANQTGFIGRIEIDGMPTLSEAFVRVTLA